MIYHYKIKGPVPSKKNKLRRSKWGGMYTDENVKAEIESLEWSIMEEKRKMRMRMIEGACFVYIEIHVPSASGPEYARVGGDRQDLDNMKTTLQDSLQKCGVIKNDRYIIADFGVKVRQSEEYVSHIFITEDVEDVPELANMAIAGAEYASRQWKLKRIRNKKV